jgi:hypothetical protein
MSHTHSLCVCARRNEILESMAGNENLDQSLTAPSNDLQDFGPIPVSVAAPSADCSAVGIAVPVCRSAKERMPRKSPTFGGINSKRRKDDAGGLVTPRAWMSCKQQEEIEGLYDLWDGKLRGRWDFKSLLFSKHNCS